MEIKDLQEYIDKIEVEWEEVESPLPMVILIKILQEQMYQTTRIAETLEKIANHNGVINVDANLLGGN